jgi:hypothetical protein
MAQKVLVELVDDLDGSVGDDIETVVFGLDGAEYTIDLNEDNAERLRDILGEFVDVARRTGGRIKRGTPAGSKRTAAAPKLTVVPTAAHRPREVTQAIREWARKNGHEVADRGRIPVSVLEEYDEAHKPETPAKSQRAGRRGPVSPRFTG